MWSLLKLSLLTQTLAFPHLLRSDEDNPNESPKLPLHNRALQTVPIDQIKEDVEALILNNPTLAAKFVRLVFHDCVGGCNGCVDFAHPDNRGLAIPVEALQPIVDSYEGQISRADVWTLAGLYSAEISTAFGGNNGGNNNGGGNR